MAFSPVKRRSPSGDRPNMSDLRIVLLGKNITENSSVENFILERAAIESEAPSADVELHIEREKGKLKIREVTVINAPQLLNPDLSSSQITQTVKEIVDLSAPGPHVIILILQQNDFTEEDRNRVKYVLNEFSDEAIKHTIVLTKEEKINNDCIHQLIQECGGGHLQFDQQKSECQSEILVRTEKILKKEEVEFLICDMYEETRRETSVDEEQSRSEGSVTTEEMDFCLEDYEHFKQSNKEKRNIAVQVPEGVCVLPKLNVALCGSDRGLKSSISKLMLEQRDSESELSSECVKLDGEVDGRLITLVELPALTLLSQKEEMRQSLRCVSLCDPGVHVFLFVISDGPLSDEDKTETEKIQKIFSSEIKKHIMVLIIQKSEHRTKRPNEAVKAVIECFGGRHYYLEPNTQVSMLVTKLEQMVEENDRRFISTEAFLEAQIEKFEETSKKLISLETQIQQKGLIEGSDDLRIVLLGKTGVGKSATGNTILGREAFKEDVSQESVTKECQRQTTDVDGRSITVIDTPGLFDTKLSQEEIQREITECISLNLPGPHVFLLLIPVVRFTQEEENAVKIIQQTFGKNSLKYTIVLFTRGDDLMKKKKTIEEYLGEPGSSLMNLIEQCGNRYHVFNNNETEDRSQVYELLQKINDMVMENGGSYYSCKIFRQMEREKHNAQMKMLMNQVDQLRKEREELLAQHEEEKDKMKMKLEEEKQNHEAEKKIREEEFKKSEEEYNTDMKRKQERLETKLQEVIEKNREKEQNIWDECNFRLKEEREEIRREKADLQAKHKAEIEKMKTNLEEEKQYNYTERRKREVEFKQNEEEYKAKQEKYKEKIEKERQNHGTERSKRENEFQKREEEYRTKLERYKEKIEKEKQKREEHEKMKEKQQNITDQYKEKIKMKTEEITRERKKIEREKADLQAKHKEEIEEMKTKMEEVKRKYDTETMRRKVEFSENEKKIKKEVKQMQKYEEEMVKQMQDNEKKRKEEKYFWIKQHEMLTKEIQIEKTLREQQSTLYEDRIKLIEKQKEDELMRQKPAYYEEDRKKEIEEMKMCCSSLQRHETGQNLKLEGNKQHQLKELYDRLDLTKRQKNKLATAEILEISKSSFHTHGPQEEHELLNSFLQNLINMDYRLRYTVIKHSTDIHPMDVQMAVFHCADSFLKQLMVTKLSQCQYALPLLVPDPFTQQIEFPLWTFRQINKSWITINTNNETISQTQPIYKAETPMVFFFRFGSVSLSKSQLVNSLINERHQTFFHRNCPGSSRTRLLMDGVVEIAWYCPSGRNTDTFDDCVAFCNLHGNAADNEKQYEILTSMASVNVLFLPDFGHKNHYKDLVKSLFKSPQPLICLLTDNNCDKTKLGNENYIYGLLNKNQCDAFSQIRDIIRETHYQKAFRLEDVTKHSGIRVDEEDPECQRGKQAALKIMNLLRGKDPSTVRETNLPCQGKLWHDWSKMNKELRCLSGENLEEDKSTKLKKMREIREKQVAQGVSEFMKTFIEQMNSQRDNERKYFLRWMMNMLDDFTAEKLCELHKEHAVKWHEVSALERMPDREDQLQIKKANLENLSEQIDGTNCGLEHILREFGQIHESRSSMKKNTMGLQFNFCSLPSLAAEMMISGFPLELMDGDAAHVPLTWVSAVFDELVKKLGDQRLFVLSVLGIQSSGKSTMLNALFGLQFAVSAGRCTRGAFMQLIKVSDEMKAQMNSIDFILVVDTEGLRAPELSGRSTTHRDNEMATFVVGLGNMTLINIFGENPSEMQDILQIVVQAFMRMKRIKLNPSCMFVHQNVSDITAGERNTEGRRRLVDKLDEMTKIAAKEEDCDAERFSDVIAFDIKKDVRYFPQLWEGSPPMAPPNPNYCENILELKKSILTNASQSDGIMLTQLRERINDLWEALLNEQFVFSFKNSLEITTYKKLETEYSKWSWSLRSAMLEIDQKLHNKIENEAINNVEETDLLTDLKVKSEEVKKKMSEFFTKDKDANMLNQWKCSTEIKIKELKENIVRETKRKLNGVLQQRHLKKSIGKERTRHENILFEKSKELALKRKDKATDEKTMRTQFDSFWRQQTTAIISETPFPKYIDILGDAKKLLKSDCMGDRSEQKDIFSLPSYSEYVKQEKSRNIKYVKYFYNKATGKVNHLAIEEGLQIKNLISDIADQTNEMIQLFNIAKMGYNITYIQQLIDNIKTRLQEHEKRPDVNYVFKKEFSIDLVLCICHRSNKTFTDQYQKFREVNDPVLYFERKGEEYYRIFQKYCKGASSTAVFGQFVCNKLKEPIEQSVYKTTARAVADEMRTNCEALNGNRSNLEKHILKTLAEKEDFDAFMRYIYNPKDHFKSFIRDEVSQYITKRFEESVRPKMENSIKLLQQQIMSGVQESFKHVEENNGDTNLWLHLFTQQLSGVLVFSESDLTEVNQDGVDVSFLEDVMVKVLPSIMSDICKFSPKTFMENLEPTDRPDEILNSHLCQCCWVQCPFCAAICTNTIEDHDGDHSVTFHRNTGLNGLSYRGTTNLSISICTSAVASDRCFYPNNSDDKVPWKEYRKGGPKYASWSITPDLSELPYWKWFVCRFQQDLEKYYEKTYEGSGKIPDEWRKYSQKEAIESLNK